MTESRRSPTAPGRRYISSEACASVSERHACCAWTGPAHRGPRPRRPRRAIDNHPPIDLQIDFVKMPSRVRLRAALAQMRGDRRLEVVHPRAHALVRHSDPAPCEQILDVTKAQCEPEIEPNRLIYDLRHEPISGIADFPHTPGYSAYLHPTSCSGVTKPLLRQSDNARLQLSIRSLTQRRC